ncbi:hypothetical protein GGX14DRAFT_461010 [Mycena pura]|uniref:Uncharacterized protein n=1 Tax=Mycena pura TaxID=153505 RepID=A0AAD6VAA6_9AGAR|nr:hypothetical protein GGX14DRAFT_461010 [Mycena pura]
MSKPSFNNCDQTETDTQLFIDNLAGLINSTFKFECVHLFTEPSVQKGPAFTSCGANSYPNLCIGGIKGQHACGAPQCQFVDWTKSSAHGCPSAILEYAQVQPMGVVAPCCNSDGCSTPSDPQNAPYTCDTSRTLYLCVNDGAAAECVDPKANTICSGNFSAAAGSGSIASQTSGLGGSETASAQGNGGQPARHLLSSKAIIAISVTAGVLVVVGVIWRCITRNNRGPVRVQPVQEVGNLRITETYHVQTRSGYYE